MLGWLSFAVAAVAAIAGFIIARNFVRLRLRFVDAVRSPAAPWIAGLGAMLLAWPAALLPVVTTATTTVFGIAAGLGTASGVKALKRGDGG